MRLRAILWACLALVAGCGPPNYGYAVRVSIDAEPSLTDSAMATIRSLRLSFFGAEKGTHTDSLPGFFADRQARFVYYPSVPSGRVTLKVLAEDASGVAVASGQGAVTLVPGQTVGLDIGLSPGAPAPAFPVTPAAPVVGRNGTVTFAADRAVDWSVEESDAGSISAAGVYVAPALPGLYHVVATDHADTSRVVSTTVTVGFNQVSVLVGAVGGAGNVDGVADLARFDPAPLEASVIAAPNGLLYVADRSNHTIRAVDTATGAVTTVVGIAGVQRSSDKAPATFDTPTGLAIDAAGATLYVAESVGATVRKVDLTQTPPVVSTLAGAAEQSGFFDGSDPTQVRFNYPVGLALDEPHGALYVADSHSNRIRKVDVHSGATSTVAGTGMASTIDSKDGAPTFTLPTGIVFDGNNTLYVSDPATVRKVVLAPLNVTTIAGTAGALGNLDGVGAAARFNHLEQIVLRGNRLALVDRANHNVRALDVGSGTVTTVAGSTAAMPLPGFQDGAAASAQFDLPSGVAAIGPDLFVLDSGNFSVRKVADAFGAAPAVTTVAGQPYRGGALDGAGATARIDMPAAMALAGDVYFSDANNATLRKVTLTPSGGSFGAAVALVAGQPGVPGAADGLGSAAGIGRANAMAVDARHNLIYFCDVGNNAIRSLDLRNAKVATLVGNLMGLRGLAFDGASTLYFTSQQGVSRLRVDTPMSTPALAWGSATDAGFVDATGTKARFAAPAGLGWDAAGGLWVADTNNSAIRRIDVGSGAVTTVGNSAGSAGFGDGDALGARFDHPTQLAVAANGQLLIGDDGNGVVRVLAPQSQEVATLLGVPHAIGVRSGAAPASLGVPRSLLSLPTGELLVGDASEAVIQIAY
jgi:sugar lactone lactonase YvrE